MLRVLLADDDQDIREVTAELLSRRGCSVTSVSSGDEAFAAMSAETFDVAVLDQNMPPGLGTEVVAKRRKVGDTTAVVLWTGWAGTLDPDEVERLDVRVLNKSGVRKLTDLVLELGNRPTG